MHDGTEFGAREQDLIRLLARWAGEGKAGMAKAGMVEMVLLAKATAIIARECLALDESAFAAAMREAYSDG
jgi:hypothetical protein